MEKVYPLAQLLLRYSIGIGFLWPVMDRMGYFGASDEPNIIWGNWVDFTAYTHLLMPFVSIKAASFFGLLATIIEVGCGIMLLIGYKIRYAALVSFGVTLIFALSMMLFLHFRAPFNYSVFVVSFSSLLLATYSSFPWSIDAYLHKRNQ